MNLWGLRRGDVCVCYEGVSPEGSLIRVHLLTWLSARRGGGRACTVPSFGYV